MCEPSILFFIKQLTEISTKQHVQVESVYFTEHRSHYDLSFGIMEGISLMALLMYRLVVDFL